VAALAVPVVVVEAMNAAPVAPLQAFYTLAQLAAMWRVQPRTVYGWLSALRRLEPDLAVTTRKRRPQGLVGAVLVAASTAQVLQDRHVLTPKDAARMRRLRGFTRRPAPLVARAS
jgi:hypothetical protein